MAKKSTRTSNAQLKTAQKLRTTYPDEQVRSSFTNRKKVLSARQCRVWDPEQDILKARAIDRLPRGYASDSNFDLDVRALLSCQPLMHEEEPGATSAITQRLMSILNEAADELRLKGLQQEFLSLHGIPTHDHRDYMDAAADICIVYPVHDTVWMVKSFRPHGHAGTIQWKKSYLTEETCYSILLATWECGSTRNRAARDMVCNLFDHHIQKVRQEAAKRFDEAVAVIADGTEIIKANQVVVFSGSPEEPHATLFEANAFVSTKIHIPNAARKITVQQRRETNKRFINSQTQSFVTELLTKKVSRTMVVFSNSKHSLPSDWNILFCNEDHAGCPTPSEGTILL